MREPQRVESHENEVDTLEDMEPEEREELETALQQALEAYQSGDRHQFVTAAESIRCLKADQ